MVRQADDPFVWFRAKTDKGFGLEISTWPEVGRERQSESETKGLRRRQLVKGDASGQSTPVSRSEQSAWVSPVPVKEDRSRWVGIPNSFVEISLEIHTSVSLHMHKGNAMLHNSSLAPSVNPSLYCSFVLCSLSSHSLDCISCSYEEMCGAPIGTTSWTPAKKWNGSKKLMCRGAGGVLSHLDLARELKKLWNMKVTVITIVFGALGTVHKGLVNVREELEIRARMETIQTKPLLSNSVKVSRRHEETCCHSKSTDHCS